MYRIKLILILIILLPCSLFSDGSISTRFTEVMIENLKPGNNYSMKKIANYPYHIKNKGSKTVRVIVRPLISDKGSLRDNFEYIPDISWVRLNPDRLIIKSLESKDSDIIIIIPDKDEYYDKRYQINITAETVSKGGFSIGLGLESVLLFTTVKKGVDVKVNKGPIDLNYDLKSSNVYINNIEIKNSGKIIKKEYKFDVINKDIKNAVLNFKILKMADTLRRIKKGYQDIPDISMIKLGTASEKLKNGQTKSVKFEVFIPDLDKFKGQKYQFVIYVSKESGEQTSGKYVNVYLEL